MTISLVFSTEYGEYVYCKFIEIEDTDKTIKEIRENGGKCFLDYCDKCDYYIMPSEIKQIIINEV